MRTVEAIIAELKTLQIILRKQWKIIKVKQVKAQ